MRYSIFFYKLFKIGKYIIKYKIVFIKNQYKNKNFSN